MKTIITVLCLFCTTILLAQVPDSTSVGLWHFDEISGSSILDSSPFHNDGSSYGATIVPGHIGNARYFNGSGNYATMPSNAAYNFQNSESFTLRAWVKTTGTEGIILRRGLVPFPGFNLSTYLGRAVGVIGNHKGQTWSDTMLTVMSTQTINDNVWHEITMVRDRTQGKLFLYVDGISAATPLVDNFTIPLTNDRVLSLGTSLALPDYFTGVIDEVGIFKGARHPVTVTSDTVALWHYDEISGSNVIDSSPYLNNGIAVGTTIVPGRFGNARDFSGSNSSVTVPNPVNGSFNFPSTQSFTVQAWFRTTQLDTGEIIRRGLAPAPGFAIRILNGHVQGIIGDTPIDQNLIRITSTRSDYNDGQWHTATLIRDRSIAQVFLYVDGVRAASPLNDNLVNPISNDLPLTMGRWENLVRPTFYRGTLDEVGIFKGARHPVTVTSDTLGIWHFDETSGSTILDSSPNHNNGTAFGASIIGGITGNARYFNGSGNYATMPSNVAYNFQNSESFTVRAWVKTTGTEGIILRRGLVPFPGFNLSTYLGRAVGVIGNHKGQTWSDTMLTVMSTQTINDNVWHEITMVRDRTQGKLFLYVDGISAATPLVDNFTIPLTNDRVLSLGTSLALPDYFTGVIDEVGIFKGARHPVSTNFPAIQVAPSQLAFGNVLVGTYVTKDVFVTNVGFHDTLYIGVETNNPVFFTAIPVTYPILPGTSRNVPVIYTPTSARTDTGSLFISSNDPNRPIVRVPLSGQGFAATAAPFITSIKDIPEDQGKQVRVVWYKSVHDSTGDPLRIVEYNLWRRVGSNNALWDFIATVPAVQFGQYAYVAPTIFDSSRTLGIRWSAFKVSAHTISSGPVYFSAADSGYSVDNIAPSAPLNFTGSFAGGHVNLSWDSPSDPDIEMFAIYRSTSANFLPSVENQIGTTHTVGFVDQSIGASSAYYYCVAAFDTAGNQGAFSSQVRVSLTDVGSSDNLPKDFALYQNYPNPFNPSSTIGFDVPTNSYITLKVYDMLGREVATLVDQPKPAGHYEVSWNAQNAASGVYIYRLQAGSVTALKKMVLMK